MSKPVTHSVLDKALFEQLFRAHYAHLCNFARQYVHDEDRAKEITQKVFINLWENREKIDPAKPLQSYLFTSVRNRSLNYIRDRKKYRSRVLDLDIVDREATCAEDFFGAEELQARISAVLDELPEKCRLVFSMSRYQHKKYREISEELGISVKTVEAHMARALRTLKDRLKDYLHLLWIFVNFLN